MPSMKELPGFYFDPEKNRYFPLKGPIPGSRRASCSSTTVASSPFPSGEPSTSNQVHQFHESSRRKRAKSFELLRLRELHGGFLVPVRRKSTFKQEYYKLQASCPTVWKYHDTAYVADTAVQQFDGVIQTPAGLKETAILATGSANGSISLHYARKAARNYDYGLTCNAELVWPPSPDHRAENLAESIWTSVECSANFPSSISCIQTGKQSSHSADGLAFRNALVTTLGSGVSGGSVYVLNLNDPVELSVQSHGLQRRMVEAARFDCTIWTADYCSNGVDAAVGTNLGAAVTNLETGAHSWVYRSKSDIFAQQFDESGNILVCGLRSGAIIIVDIRLKHSGQLEPSDRSRARRHIGLLPHTRLSRHNRSSHKHNLKIGKNLGQLCMSSSVCSLVVLRSDDQYFLASSMDGYIKLFDRRLLQRGAVQSYMGHVNTHSSLQLAVDPSENLLMSGGEDCFVRIWSIKSGELLFGEKVANSIMTSCCWPDTRYTSYGIRGSCGQEQQYNVRWYEPSKSWGAWLGSHEGLFYIHGS